MSPASKAYYILRHLGPRVVWLRAGVYLNKRLGLTRRTFRSRAWEQIDLASITVSGTPVDAEGYARFKQKNPPPFLFSLGEPPGIPDAIHEVPGERTPGLARRIGLLTEDRCVYFSSTPSPEPIDWHKDPFSGGRADPHESWCNLPDFQSDQGDPRTLWEPSRAAWAIDIARGRARGLADATGALLWRWVDSWMTANPPFVGFQWKCGQESSVRMIALTLGFWSLAGDAAITPDRWVRFARLAWATGYRVAHHINYAISQKNNHALAEACGLLLVSHLFPEFRESGRWQALGRKVLARELRRQVYADGSYLQHSMNYHRVMLHVGILGLRLAELAGRPFAPDIYDRLRRGGEFIFQMLDPDPGRVPNYGHNDGANILPLSETDFADYRPVVQAVHFLTTRRRRLPSGPWDEALVWLFGPEALAAEVEEPGRPRSTTFDHGGYYTLRRDHSWAMIRGHTYRDRPGQCDPLHVDLWWRGLNVLQDCGTYRYYVPGREDVERYFKSMAGHNTIEVDGRDPMEAVSRFLWLPWLQAKTRYFDWKDEGVICFEGEHYGYDRPPTRVVHRRTVISPTADLWLVVDDLFGSGEHNATLRWHMIDAPYKTDQASSKVTLATSKGEMTLSVAGHPYTRERFEVVRGRDEAGRVQGFAAPYYGARDPIPTLETTVPFENAQRLLTVVSFGKPLTVNLPEQLKDRQRWEIASGDDSWIMELARPERSADRTLLRFDAPAQAAAPSA